MGDSGVSDKLGKKRHSTNMKPAVIFKTLKIKNRTERKIPWSPAKISILPNLQIRVNLNLSVCGVGGGGERGRDQGGGS